MNYKKAAMEFINIAFNLVYLHEHDQNSTYCRGTLLLYSVDKGKPYYTMSVGETGRLNVSDTRLPPGHQIITHSSTSRTSEQMTLSIARMLHTYLKRLQDEHRSTNA